MLPRGGNQKVPPPHKCSRMPLTFVLWFYVPPGSMPCAPYSSINLLVVMYYVRTIDFANYYYLSLFRTQKMVQ